MICRGAAVVALCRQTFSPKDERRTKESLPVISWKVTGRNPEDPGLAGAKTGGSREIPL